MRVLKDSFIYLLGEIFAKSLPFLMLPYLTRKLGADGFGELSYYLTMLALFGIFVGLSQEGAITRYYYFYGKKALNTVVKAGYLYNILISSMLLLFCWLYNAEIMAYVVLATMFQSFLNVQLALRQCQKQPFKYIIIQIILSLANVCFTVIALEFFHKDLVALRILAIVAANAVTFFIASMIMGNLFKEKSKLTWQRLKLGSLYIITFGGPLILHQSSFFVKGQLDRLFIYQQYSKAELGIYSAGVQIASVLPIILMALNKAIVPYYYKELKEGNLTIDKIKKYALICLPVSLIPSLLAWLIPVNLYSWFLGAGYAESKYFVIMYLLGYALNFPYLILVNYLFFYAKNKLIAVVTFISSLVYLVLLFILGSKTINAIPFALIFSNIVMLVILWIMVNRKA